jgi:hypothetical protein
VHEWTDVIDASFSTIRISSRDAPAARAARMWRRAPSGLSPADAAFSAKLISSTVLRGRTAEVDGLVVILKQVSAHTGSHSRSSSTASSQEVASGG